MLRPGMKPVDGTPGVGTPSKPKPEPEETKPSYVPGGGRPGHPEPTLQPEPTAGPPAFDAGPSPYYTQEVTSYAQPPTSEAEAQRREQRKERAAERWEKARKQAPATATPPEIVEAPDIADLGLIDSAQANDESRFQIGLPDIEEAQDECGINLDRLHAFSNLEFLLVWQDMERRPLTFKRCFEQAESPRSALEFIYAEPPDLDDNAMIHLQDYLSRELDTLSGGWGITGGREDSSTPDIDPGLLSSVYKVEAYLETKYGYQIEWGEGFYNVDRLEQLYSLAQSSAHIVDFLDLVYKDDPNTTGKEAFQEHFSQSKDHGQLVVQLGADAYLAESLPDTSVKDAGYHGFVPLDGKNKMFLGSEVDISTIVHEFGHVVDRSKHIEDTYGEKGLGIAAWYDWYNETGLVLNESILQHAVEGFAAKQLLREEIWADLFMTAVLDPSVSGTTFLAYSTTYDLLRKFVEQVEAELIEQGYDKQTAEQIAAGAFYDCAERGGCTWRPVKWVEEEAYRVKHAALPKDQFLILFRRLLGG